LLLGLTYVHEAARHPPLAAYLSRLMNGAIPPSLGTPLAVLTPPPTAFSLPAYTTSLAARFADAGVGDALARVAQDGSSKYPAQLMPIVREVQALPPGGNGGDGDAGGSTTAAVPLLAFAVATWAAALAHPTLPVEDGRRAELRALLAVAAGEAPDAGVRRLLGVASIFGADGRRGGAFAEAVVAQFGVIGARGVAAALDEVLAA